MSLTIAFFGGIVAGIAIAVLLLGCFFLFANKQMADEVAERESAEWRRRMQKATEA